MDFGEKCNCFNTVNGKYCCNVKEFEEIEEEEVCFNTVNGKYCCNGYVPTEPCELYFYSFNTVNGKYCCNVDTLNVSKEALNKVSIP